MLLTCPVFTGVCVCVRGGAGSGLPRAMGADVLSFIIAKNIHTHTAITVGTTETNLLK